MLNWIKKTAGELNTIAVNTFNTPAPVGKVLLISGGILVGTFLITHKMKIILVFG